MKHGNANYLRKRTHGQLTTPDFFVNEVLGGRKLNMPTHKDFGIITSRIVEGVEVDRNIFVNPNFLKASADFTRAICLSRIEGTEKELQTLAKAFKTGRVVGVKLREKIERAHRAFWAHRNRMGEPYGNSRRAADMMGDKILLYRKAHRKLVQNGLETDRSFVGHIMAQGSAIGSQTVYRTWNTGK